MKINARYLKGLLRLAAVNDIRYYLNGVLFETSKEDGKFYVGTDGRRLGIFHEDWKDEEPYDVRIIIPRDVIEQARLLKQNGLTNMPPASLEPAGSMWTLNTHEGARLTFTAIEGKFPEWRAVFPKKISGEVGHYDFGLLYGFVQCVQDAWPGGGINYTTLRQNGDGVGIVRCSAVKEFVGLIMPWRISEDDSALPAWTKQKEESVAA